MNLTQLKRGKNSPHLHMDDETFSKIIREKNAFRKERQKHRQQRRIKQQIAQEKRMKNSEIQELRIKEDRKQRAEEGLVKIEKYREEREQRIKDSLNYKFLKDQEPLYRKIIKQREMKDKEVEEFFRNKEQKNKSVALGDLLKHSKIFESKKQSEELKRYVSGVCRGCQGGFIGG